MILRWLRKKILTTTDPDRVLVFCAAFGAIDTMGLAGAVLVFYQAFKKRKKEKQHGNRKQKEKVS